MINERTYKVLGIISNKLRHKNIKWRIGGSTNLALQGIKIKAPDIDIITDKQGAYEINKILKEYEIIPVKFSRTEKYASHFGKFRINRTNIEVIGNLNYFVNGKWLKAQSMVLNKTPLLKLGGFGVRITPLQYQLKSYQKMKRKADSTKIKKIINLLKNRR